MAISMLAMAILVKIDVSVKRMCDYVLKAKPFLGISEL